MSITYATFEQYTAVYSDKGVSQSEINSVWLNHGALRVNEALGAYFTIPFSSNNQTSRELSIHYGHLGILYRTRNQKDSQELESLLDRRVKQIVSGAPMIDDSNTPIYASDGKKFEAWSNTQDYKNTFDMRNAIDQRVDPDLIDALNDEDF